ncbi:hypothetical protein PVAND_003434 [Polypedilum vanderplanki]|uniref:MD-2-related lipid-recognition domain-containing protein n=1 Tax=Polypedilum vanderplanki TaxID=319348 RepID=A0A9J6BUH3_POLVA|nr:hypothetical protein PVAND_003434 [Polypedilum vanderplanki]
MFKFVIFGILLVLSSANAFWTRCADHPNAVAPDHITSPACTPERCTATRGEVLTADVLLTPIRAHNRLDVRVTAFVLGVGVPLPLEPPYDNACNHMYRNNVFVGCPTVPNVQHLWRINMLLSPNYPALNNARVRFEISENGVVEGCVDITATLV